MIMQSVMLIKFYGFKACLGIIHNDVTKVGKGSFSDTRYMGLRKQLFYCDRVDGVSKSPNFCEE